MDDSSYNTGGFLALVVISQVMYYALYELRYVMNLMIVALLVIIWVTGHFSNILPLPTAAEISKNDCDNHNIGSWIGRSSLGWCLDAELSKWIRMVDRRPRNWIQLASTSHDDWPYIFVWKRWDLCRYYRMTYYYKILLFLSIYTFTCLEILILTRNLSLSDAEERKEKVFKMGSFWNHDALLCVICYCITSSIWFQPSLEAPDCKFIYSTFMVWNICCCLICISGISKVFVPRIFLY